MNIIDRIIIFLLKPIFFIADLVSPLEDDIEEFEEKFPGRCIICSYHRFGLQEGYVDPGTKPDKHEGCPEDN